MYDTNLRRRFIELRGQGISLATAAKRLKVSKRTLVEWNRQDRDAIRSLRAAQVEAVMEETILSLRWNLSQLNHHLERIENELYSRDHSRLLTVELHRLAAFLRGEIRKIRREYEPLLGNLDAPSEDATRLDPERQNNCGNQNCTISAPETNTPLHEENGYTASNQDDLRPI